MKRSGTNKQIPVISATFPESFPIVCAIISSSKTTLKSKHNTPINYLFNTIKIDNNSIIFKPQKLTILFQFGLVIFLQASCHCKSVLKFS
jgi:hypothetical protein